MILYSWVEVYDGNSLFMSSAEMGPMRSDTGLADPTRLTGSQPSRVKIERPPSFQSVTRFVFGGSGHRRSGTPLGLSRRIGTVDNAKASVWS